MIRVFVTAISLQGANGLERGYYHPEGFELRKNRETSFPIIPIISENMRNGKDVKIIALRTQNSDTKDNYIAFLRELKELNIKEENVVPIEVEEKQDKNIGLKTLLRIIDEIPQDSLVYADITYGTKPMSIIILYAISFIEKLKDSEVEGIFYGELPRKGAKSIWEKAKLYDLTIYKYLSDVIDQLRGLDVSDPRNALRKLIDM